MLSGDEACNDCDGETSRRGFLTWAGGCLLAAGSSTIGADDSPRVIPETAAQELFATLDADQRKVLAFPWEHPLRQKANANWKITKPQISEFKKTQQDLVDRILRGVTSDEGYEKFRKQMLDDGGGMGAYHIAFFGRPGDGKKFDFVMTGRHMTLRCDGNHADGVAFGGPMVYGHQGQLPFEKPDHPGNVFWYQAKRANEVFRSLDGKQRERAIVMQAPKQEAVEFRKQGFPGLSVAELAADQRRLVEAVIPDLLSPYRKEDGEEVMKLLAAGGGVEKLNIAFYRKDEDGENADIGDDGVWDLWRLEGPGFVWHFRGFPHVHVWVNVARPTRAQPA